MTVVLFAHERPSVARAVSHVLHVRGFEVEAVRDGDAAMRALESRHFGALVVDVALPRRPGYELVEVARAAHARAGRGANVVVLLASVFRKTSYKRRPARLYGADDYVELHRLGDTLPDKLDRHLGVHSPQRDEASRKEVAQTQDEPHEDLAALIIADVVLYNSERVAATHTLAEARAALADDLDVATDLLRQVQRARAEAEDAEVAIEAAFTRLMRSMGRREEACARAP